VLTFVYCTLLCIAGALVERGLQVLQNYVLFDCADHLLFFAAAAAAAAAAVS
jgi:hypothetical protein